MRWLHAGFGCVGASPCSRGSIAGLASGARRLGGSGRTRAARPFSGVLLAAGFSALLVLQAMTFEATLTLITVGNGLIGAWS